MQTILLSRVEKCVQVAFIGVCCKCLTKVRGGTAKEGNLFQPSPCTLTFASALLNAGSSSSTSKYISLVVMDKVPRATSTGATSWAGLLRTTGPAEGHRRALSVTRKILRFIQNKSGLL